MPTLTTEQLIDAPRQTVWSILDDVSRYGAWNRVLPRLEGLTLVGRTVQGTIAFSGQEANAFEPVITRIVGARELRWLTEVPGEQGYRAEHYFILEPDGPDRTRLIHCEAFGGALADVIWPMVDTVARADYEAMNLALKDRAEALANDDTVALHPAVGADAPEPGATIDRLHCLCEDEPVELSLPAGIAHNHLCGCSKCWKPAGALFAQTAVAPADAWTVTRNAEKLAPVDERQSIVRHACRACGAHVYGSVADPDHHFYGLIFVHPELAEVPAPAPEFAGFVSSLIETGTSPSAMVAVRRTLERAGIPAYDVFSPEIMDLIAWHKVKLAHAAG